MEEYYAPLKNHKCLTIKDINHQVKYVLLDVLKIWMSSPPFAPYQYKQLEQVTISTANTMYTTAKKKRPN